MMALSPEAAKRLARFRRRTWLMVGLCLVCQAVAPALDVPSAIGATPARLQSVPTAVAFTADGRIILPRDYRDRAFLSSGLDMNYEATGPAGQPRMFDNVFVNRAALAVFRRTRQRSDGTVLVKESREGLTKGSINKAGQVQAEPVAEIRPVLPDACADRAPICHRPSSTGALP